MAELVDLDNFLRKLSAHGSAPLSAWPANLEVIPASLGLVVVGDEILTHGEVDLLDADELQKRLSDFAVSCHAAIDSTNSALLEAATASSIDHRVVTAECQLAGRGRRGRGWLSPYARNLAVSMGFSTSRPIAELGGLSLVVGIALAEYLEQQGGRDILLKWPNDVLFEGAKLCGILVELSQGPNGVQIVVGIGVNVSLTAEDHRRIAQSVADLRETGVRVSRTELVAGIVRAVADRLQHFEAHGFAVFKPAFDRRHAFQRQVCTVVQGEQRIVGEVTGVGDHGELLMATPAGERAFVGGEVSLRQR